MDAVPFWWHSIELGDGMVTPGQAGADELREQMARLRLPELRGRSVLDIGAWDGYFSFAAERAGARRVVALDHYVWSLDLPAQQRYWRECRERGEVPRQYHEVPELWRPKELPGMAGFRAAHRALASRVEPLVADYMKLDAARLGRFDMVLYLGVLYHMEDPLAAMRRVSALTGELAVIETEAVVVPGLEHVAFCQFFESNELNADVGNWWAPNLKALAGLCRAAGFAAVDVVAGPPEAPSSGEPLRYRAIVHARRE